jgi:hypothetical protein
LAGLSSKSNIAAGRFYTTSRDEDQLSSHLGKLRAQYELRYAARLFTFGHQEGIPKRPDGIIVAVLDIYP